LSTKQHADTKSQNQAVTNDTMVGEEHQVYFGENIGQINTPIYRRDALTPGDYINGPALIVESQTTTLVEPEFDVMVDALGYLVLTRREEEQDISI